MRIGLLSDTHGILDDAILGSFSECDEIWHAGDFGSAAVLDELRKRKPVKAVWGNIDGPGLRAALPFELAWQCEGVDVYMTHIGGHPGRYPPRVRQELLRRRPDVFICGHSHILRVARDPKGWLYLNPGACGHQGWHKVRTLLRFTVQGAVISNVEAVDLGPRGRTGAH